MEERNDRREFLKRLAAVTAGAGAAAYALGSGAEAGPIPERALSRLKGTEKAFADVLNFAMEKGDMTIAIKEKGTGLKATDRELLAKLDKRDLTDLKRILDKMADRIGASADGNFVY